MDQVQDKSDEETRDQSRGVWAYGSNGSVPLSSVVGGRHVTGENYYVARAVHGNSHIPGSLVPSKKCVLVAFGGEAHNKTEYEVLTVGPNTWVKTKDSDIPTAAFDCGKDVDGSVMYAGRVDHEGSTIIGKVQKKQGSCKIAYDGKELEFKEYEILVSE